MWHSWRVSAVMMNQNSQSHRSTGEHCRQCHTHHTFKDYRKETYATRVPSSLPMPISDKRWSNSSQNVPISETKVTYGHGSATTEKVKQDWPRIVFDRTRVSTSNVRLIRTYPEWHFLKAEREYKEWKVEIPDLPGREMARAAEQVRWWNTWFDRIEVFLHLSVRGWTGKSKSEKRQWCTRDTEDALLYS